MNVGETIKESVADRLIRLWNVPPARRRPTHRDLAYSFDAKVSAATVFKNLGAEFSTEEVEVAVIAALRTALEIYVEGDIPDGRDVFLATCALDLTAAPDLPLEIPVTLLKDVVRAYPSIVWYIYVGQLVAERLTKLDTLEALCDGITLDGDVDICLSCLNGLIAYRQLPKPDEQEELAFAVKQEIRARIEQLRQHPDPTVVSMTAAALISLDRW